MAGVAGVAFERLIDPLLGEQVEMADVPAALARLGSRDTIGKVTVRVG